ERLIGRLILAALAIIFDKAGANFAMVIPGSAECRQWFVERLTDTILAKREQMAGDQILVADLGGHCGNRLGDRMPNIAFVLLRHMGSEDMTCTVGFRLRVFELDLNHARLDERMFHAACDHRADGISEVMDSWRLSFA